MITDIIWLIVGLALILFGANWLTDSSSAVARRMGVSDMVIGLTVVAFGTSAPELAISIVSAVDQKAALAVGNTVGSNIFNILVIIGVIAMVHPIRVEKSVMTREIPIVILTALLMLLFGYAPQLDPGSPRSITRLNGIMLLIFFILYLRYTLASAKRAKPVPDMKDPVEEQVEEKVGGKEDMPIWKAILLIIIGLAALVFGGDKFVDGASGIAKSFGLSDAVIGLTIVAVGTSLPEFATSVVAAIKGKPGLVIGNVIGSNILNVLLVLGLAGTIFPLPFGSITQLDLWVEFGASLLFLLSGWLIGHRVITRLEGLLFLLCYVAYTTFLILSL